jgi:glutamate synthase domain-containing protein 3
MMRVCHKNTCPVGVATQDPELRKHFTGDPAHTVNFMTFIAQEVRESWPNWASAPSTKWWAAPMCWSRKQAVDHWKAKGIDLSKILHQPEVGPEVGRYCQIPQDHGLEKSLDITTLLDLCQPAIEKGESVRATLPITNVNRVVGTILGNEITKRHWDGLPEDTVQLHFQGSAGQSFGAFVPKGVTLELEGEANDYLGKGLSGGKLILYPPKPPPLWPRRTSSPATWPSTGRRAAKPTFAAWRGTLLRAQLRGEAVVEGVGDHACEYMTGGKAVCWGPHRTQLCGGHERRRRLRAGRSGRFCHPLQHRNGGSGAAGRSRRNSKTCGRMIQTMWPIRQCEAIAPARSWNWDMVPQFVKVMPRDYKRVLQHIQKALAKGLDGDDALSAAFEENARDTSAAASRKGALWRGQPDPVSIPVQIFDNNKTMGKPTGFMEFLREVATEVTPRSHPQLGRVSPAYARGKPADPGSPLHGLRHPLLPHGHGNHRAWPAVAPSTT